MQNITQALKNTDWALFVKQKQALIAACEDHAELEGLVNWIDQLQDALVEDGLAPEQQVFPKEAMSQETLNALYDLAANSVFFKQDDLTLRIDYTGNTGFHCHDESTSEEYWVRFDEIDLDKDSFYRVEVVKLNELVVDLAVNS